MKKKTVSKTFSTSLQSLMDKLRATEHHYIRCLKPNQTLKAGDWDNDFMFKQLAYSGTLEVTQIRKAGLNVRRPLKHFYQYYKICADDPAALRAGTVTKRTELLLKQLSVDTSKYRVGKTLLFLQNYDIIDALASLAARSSCTSSNRARTLSKRLGLISTGSASSNIVAPRLSNCANL